MKRKLALLLAVSMVLSMLPMNMSLFASSDNSLSKVPSVIGEKAVFVESDLMGTADSRLLTTVVEIKDNDDVKAVVDGTYLLIEPKNDIVAGSTIKLQLENAKWFFRQATNGVVSTKWYGTITGTALQYARNGAIAPGTTTNDRQLGFAGAGTEFGLQNTFNTINGCYGEVLGGTYARLTASGDSAKPLVAGGFTSAVPALNPGGIANTHSGQPYYYTMTVSTADDTIATVTFPEGVLASESSSRSVIRIPLVVRSTRDDSADIKVTITDTNNTTVSGGSWVFGATSSTLTKTTVNDPKTARDEFPINRIVIQEQRVGSMGSGTIRITAPSGYEFASNALNHVHIIAENFGYATGANSFTMIDTNGLSTVDGYYSNGNARIGFRQTRGESDYSVIEIEFYNLSQNKSNRVAGTIYIRDSLLSASDHVDANGENNLNHFKLIADDNAAWGDVMLKITNGSGDDVVTEETFRAGTRKDWTIDFQALGTIPTLVNGRYYQDDSVFAEDEEHLAATIKFYENTVNAWWSGRYTDFILPEGVKIRKAEITKAKNMVQEDELRNDKRTNRYAEDYYMNTGKKDGYVTVSDSKLSINNVQVTTDKKAEIEMKLWLSIESGYEGDVTLTATGSGVPDEMDPIVIAKAVNPVEINTTVTDVRIGYQYYQVADIELVETGAGMLEKNKQVWLTVTDRINMDMYFTPGFKWEITEGNIKIKNVDLGTGSKITVSSRKITNNKTNGDLGSGTIVFDVDSVSSTASTIKFSNLQLKIDRTVPESSQEHYSVYAWGPNIAPNADIFDYTEIYSSVASGKTLHFDDYVGNDQHSSLGIHVPYVRVVTSAIDKNNILSSVVKITAGSTTAYVNGDAVTVDPAPFIDAATSRFQVPVRAIATLLGIREEQILWSDADRTVTINMVNRTIQFAIGSDLMLVNGAQVRMDTAAMIVNGRTFIPFKYLGDALGVTVGYDDATKTATYNDAE